MLFEVNGHFFWKEKVKLRDPVFDGNTGCWEKKRRGLSQNTLLYLNEVEVTVFQIRPFYSEVSIRCPYCKNLIASFGLQGINLKEDCDKLKRVDWNYAIDVVRENWKRLHCRQKVVFDFSTLSRR